MKFKDTDTEEPQELSGYRTGNNKQEHQTGTTKKRVVFCLEEEQKLQDIK